MKRRVAWVLLAVAGAGCEQVLDVPTIEYGATSASPSDLGGAGGAISVGAGGVGGVIASAGAAGVGGSQAGFGAGSGGSSGSGGSEGGAPDLDAGVLDGSDASDGAGGGSSTSCKGLPVDLTSNSLNCGVCGHSCQGGTCTGGQCDPVQLLTGDLSQIILALDPAPEKPIYFADYYGQYVGEIDKSGNNFATDYASSIRVPDVVIDDSYIYAALYDDNKGTGDVVRISRSNTADVVNMSGPINGVWKLVLDADNLYAAIRFNGGAILRMPLASPGTVEHVIDVPDDAPLRVLVDDTRVYWYSYTPPNDHIRSIAKTGGPVTTHVTANALDGFGIHGDYLYWTQNVAIFRVLKDGSAPTETIANNYRGSNYAFDGDELYFTADGTASGTDALFGMPVDGSAEPTLLLDGLHAALSLALDAKCFYVGEGDQHDGIIKVARPP